MGVEMEGGTQGLRAFHDGLGEHVHAPFNMPDTSRFGLPDQAEEGRGGIGASAHICRVAAKELSQFRF